MTYGFIPLIIGIVFINCWYYLSRDFMLLSMGLFFMGGGIAMLSQKED